MRDNLARVADEEPPSDIDVLIADLEAARDNHTPLPPEVTKPPTRHKGGVPKFFSHEVAAIRADPRTIVEIAEEWACSFDTILRVRQQGRFASVPYVARDDVQTIEGSERRIIMREYQPATASKKGRPFKSGRREPISSKEMIAIAQDARHANLVAKDFQISPAYVNKIRREMGTALIHRAPLTDGTIAQIEAAKGGYEDIALTYRIPTALVKWIKGVP